MMFRSLIFVTLAASAAGARASAQEPVPTTVEVRVVARDAKLIGDVVGGARVTITDVTTGDTLASGLTRGGTGDTRRIMRTPRERGMSVFDTPGAAGWLATFGLRRPTEIEISAQGPVDFPEATAAASRRMLIGPGAEITGDGIVLELHGYIVEILDAGGSAAGGRLPVRARVRMMCSCPTEPGGLWEAGKVTARLVADGRVVSEAPLAYSGTTSEYAGKVSAPAGAYTLEVLAANPATANFGIARRSVDLPGRGASRREAGPGGGAGPAVAAPEPLEQRIDAYMRPYVAMDHFAGALLVARRDDVLVRRAWGLADRALGVPFTPETRFRIGSITKDFTAGLIFLLADDGRLSLDDPLARFLPNFPNGNRIRIRHLLNHTHGVPNWRELPMADSLETSGISITEAAKVLGAQPLQFEPGSRRRYGSSGYLLLARVVEVVAGKPYERVLHDRILGPLGLTHTGSLRGLEIVPGLAESYVPSGTPPWLRRPRPTNPSITVGSASMFSTIADLLRWTRSPLAERVGGGGGTAWGHRLLWTSGLTDGFVIRIHRFPDDGVTLILASNIFTPAFRPILMDVAGMVFDQTTEPPAVWRPVPLTPDARGAMTGRWTCESGIPWFTIEASGDTLRFTVSGGATFPLVPQGPDRLHLPTDYATLTFRDRGASGYQRVAYEGGFSSDCSRAIEAEGP